ncbi:MAG: hypothetical protein JWM80_6151 [Cyanobacteria bacterium RYN_339]|nr:hypothetical protein [Cyanobacteria bacterium RYN_339]
MIDLGTIQKTKLTAANGPGWVRLGAVPPAEAIARAKGNAKDDIVVQVGRDVYIATTTGLAGPAAAGSAIDLVTPEGEHLAGAIVYVDHETPKPPMPTWKRNVGYAGFGALLLGFGTVAVSMSGLVAAAVAMPAFVVGGVGFLVCVLAFDIQL